MMKKKILLILVICLIFLPKNVFAVTLGEYESKVKKYESDLKKAQESIKLTDQQIANSKAEINNITKENKRLEEEIHNLNEEIEKGKKEIKEKSLQTKQLFEYLQVANGENAYLEYAFGADNMTDFIYRMSIVEQMAEYNKEVTEELEEMIDRNNKREEEIHKKEKQLATQKKNLEKKVISLGEDKAAFQEFGIDSQKQLKIYQELVSSYKKLGCKSSHVIGVDCAVNGPAGKFRRPTKVGSITSEFGWRWGTLHQGVDITSPNRKREKIYPVANGTIIAKFYDTYGALMLMIEHYDSSSNIWYTSTYAHMSKYASGLYVGKYVTSDQYIGYMGNTGYVLPAPTASNPDAGTHLHLEIGACRVYKDNKCGSWYKYVDFLKQQLNKGFKGPRQLINFPSAGVKWTTR